MASKKTGFREDGVMTDLGGWTESDLDALLQDAQRLPAPGARIGFLSKQFLGVPYRTATLAGSAAENERLVVNISGVDCFTFLDYLEAMRRSASHAEFVENLKNVRYRNGVVDYLARNHFFSDWPEHQPEFISDVTAAVGGDSAVSIEKMLNVKADGSYWLAGIALRRRNVTFIPSERFDTKMLAKLQTGDYIGIYTDLAGLDVAHVGVIVKGPFMFYLRHASSAPGKMRVLDDELAHYLADKPGACVYRAK